MFDNFIDEFIPVSGLRKYLKNDPISDSEVADIIVYARASLKRKREALFEHENMEISGNRMSGCMEYSLRMMWQ